MTRPARVGPYEVLFELAQGGMGAVFLARAVGEPVGAAGFERVVAIKRLHAHLGGQAEHVRRFLDEARVAARIHHANVVGIHQLGSDEDGYFLVQDYVEGDTLEGLVDRATLRRRRLPPPIVLRIALDALAGLAAVHEARDAEGRPLDILHRDLSPQNLLVGRDGVTRLADFGIAKHALRSVVTDGRYLQGRVLYMPPEVLTRRPVDQRLDVYGVGMTLWTALAGHAPWPDAGDAQIIHLAVTEGLPPLSATGLVVAPAVEALVARAVSRDPEARFPSARAMRDAVEHLGRHTGWIASHAEVAAEVEALAGAELSARRAVLSAARSSGEVTGVGVTPSPRPGGGAFAWALVALVLATGVAALVWSSRRPAAIVAAASAPSAPVSSASSAAPPAVLDPPPPSAPVAPSAAPSAPAAPVPRAPAPRASARAPAPVASAPATRGPDAPSDIRTANPYR
jgi:serine/threonine-protein kinase